MSNPSVRVNPTQPGQFAILPTTDIVKPIYHLVAKLPSYYGINPTLIVLTAINSLSLNNPAILEYYIHEFMKDIQATAAGNCTKLDPAHEEELAKTIIMLWYNLTNLFTKLQLWSADGKAFWKFYSFTNYDIIMRYTGVREDELRTSSGSGDPIIGGVY